ncbi:hypothetical protein [Streptomyces platensis]|uniref:hypothetical protein n=1 Tax=Streptomyces platensis TaxID=58346 RepID=UPI00386CAFA0|nr:hypothetical protein OG962_16535 [Streptomyces platensis]
MDLAFLQPLYADGSSVVSVHLNTSRGTHDADKQIGLRWRAARRALLRSAVLGGAAFTEILPPTRCTDGVAALLRY